MALRGGWRSLLPNRTRATHVGRFASWSAALEKTGATYVDAKAAKGGGSAWDHGAVLPVASQRRKVQDRLLHYLAFLSLRSRKEIDEPVRVLDFGGGRGLYGQLVGQLGVLADGSSWTVVDVPSVVRRFSDTSFIHFRLEKEIVGPFSHVILGAVLQVLPDPFEVFDRLRALSPQAFVLITHLPTHAQGASFVTVSSRAEKEAFPYWVFGESDVARFVSGSKVVFRVATPHFSGHMKDVDIRFETLMLAPS